MSNKNRDELEKELDEAHMRARVLQNRCDEQEETINLTGSRVQQLEWTIANLRGQLHICREVMKKAGLMPEDPNQSTDGEARHWTQRHMSDVMRAS